ncbi:uncharacterized protein ACIQIH_000130 [Cyanocitta cristata]
MSPLAQIHGRAGGTVESMPQEPGGTMESMPQELGGTVESMPKEPGNVTIGADPWQSRTRSRPSNPRRSPRSGGTGAAPAPGTRRILPEPPNPCSRQDLLREALPNPHFPPFPGILGTPAPPGRVGVGPSLHSDPNRPLHSQFQPIPGFLAPVKTSQPSEQIHKSIPARSSFSSGIPGPGRAGDLSGTSSPWKGVQALAQVLVWIHPQFPARECLSRRSVPFSSPFQPRRGFFPCVLASPWIKLGFHSLKSHAGGGLGRAAAQIAVPVLPAGIKVPKNPPNPDFWVLGKFLRGLPARELWESVTGFPIKGIQWEKRFQFSQKTIPSGKSATNRIPKGKVPLVLLKNQFRVGKVLPVLPKKGPEWEKRFQFS